eukprot:TRINITY_DN21825_c0_g1_i3.p1 TRINITY_DN21825_c0_g1~~TRINITY_DN21825_c0_g1_i3.p1  ORF type:complete len:295 (+),score=16.21 TRINITY_DN21825_c0_g1_i3:86-970(+)
MKLLRLRRKTPLDGRSSVHEHSGALQCLGRDYYGQPWQTLNLDPNGCNYIGVALHELGHTLGLSHEHERYDRDNYLKVNVDNVAVEAFKVWFKVGPWRNAVIHDIPYDLSSIMHYDETAFAKNGTKTIEVIREDDWGNCKIGNRQQLSTGDILTVRGLYACSEAFCADRHHKCAHTACDGEFKEWMQVHCPAKCGLCTCQNAHDPDGESSECEQYVRMGMCPHHPEGTPENQAWMRVNCAKSCGICGPADSTCVDKNPDIKGFCSPYDCTNDFWGDCQRTCGNCAAEVFCPAVY